MALGKQVGTYLHGDVAARFEKLAKDMDVSIYKLLTRAVVELLEREAGYVPKKKSSIGTPEDWARIMAEKEAAKKASVEPERTVEDRRAARRRRRLGRN